MAKDDPDPTKLPTALQERLLYTKAKAWAYENEVRRLVDLKDMDQDGSLCFCPFSSSLILHEVIIGARCSLQLRAVRKLLRTYQPQAIAFKARLAFKSFSIVPVEHTVP
ncbi:DUF2971 domain-containing protein [Bradyrhizobium sp. Gha]|uniref:DUF2971 domain-containing protein n=1 Tax=Bradyrhizobium sp. Gha TaxID=1855318 RepID=UPI0011600B3A|nr:DUF2971 domain-containing protein [Bradyrhizobium sp. Gha]